MPSSFTRRSVLMSVAAALTAQIATPIKAATGSPAPEFSGLENWLNSDPLHITDLRGKLVLVDFWTFGCSNCISTLPHLKSWYEEFAEKDFEIIGVHTPEFAFERELDGLKEALARFGISYPVAQDNKYQTWRAYEVRYWPTSVLVGRNGDILTYHEGSSGLEGFGEKIRATLGES